jgi:hypothetical protein
MQAVPSNSQLRSGSLQSSLQFLAAHQPNPLLADFARSIEQEEQRLCAMAELPLELVIPRIVNIEVDKVDLIPIHLFEPVHDGRHALAGRSPEGEELKQDRLASAQGDSRRIGCLQPRPRRRGGG